MAMTPAQKNVLLKNRVILVRSLIITDDFLALLTADYSLTESMRDQIVALKTKQQQASKLLELLACRPQKAFRTFIKALVDTDQEHLAEPLDRQSYLKFLTDRQIRRGEVVQPIPDHQLPPSANPGVLTPTTQYPQKMVHEATLPPQFTPPPAKETKPATNELTTPVPAEQNTVLPCPQQRTTGALEEAQTSFPFDQDMDVDDDEQAIISQLQQVRVSKDANTLSLLSELPNTDSFGVYTHSKQGQTVQRGFGVVLVADRMGAGSDSPQASSISITAVAAENLWESSKFTMKTVDRFTLQALNDTLRKCTREIQSCDAFMLYFLGFGKRDGRIFDVKGTTLSIHAELLPMFTTDRFPDLAGKSKTFIFNVANPDDQTVDSPGVDIVDAKTSDPKWNDMVIFYTISPVRRDAMDVDAVLAFDLPVQALFKVACKFVGQETILGILKKVKKILDAMNGDGTALYATPCSVGKKHVFLRTLSKEASH